MSDYSPDIYYPENEIDRLRADLIAAQGYRAAAEEIAKRRGEMVDALIAERDEAREQLRLANIDQFNSEAEVAALKAHDPLAEMWRELEEYQPFANRDGHGESWARMCEERTEDAAERAQEVAEVASISSGLADPYVAAMSARWAVAWRQHSEQNTQRAIAAINASAIRRAKEGQR
jgi:phosphopantothenate synthetase